MSARRYTLDAQRDRIEARRVLAPGGTVRDRRPSDLKEPVHVPSFEGLAWPLAEALGNPGHVVVDAVALGEQVELVEIADALRADQGRDRAAGNRERAAVDGLEVGPRSRIADDVEPERPLRDGCAQALGLRRMIEPEVVAAEGRRIKHDLRHRTAVYMHFMEMVAAAFDIHHDRRERARDRCR